MSETKWELVANLIHCSIFRNEK